MVIKGVIFDFGFTLAYFKDVSLRKYFDCFNQGLLESVELLKQNNIINDKAIINQFIKLFKETRMFFFKESIKTKTEYPTASIYKIVLEKTIERNIVANLQNDFLIKLATTYHKYEENEWIPFEDTNETLNELHNRKKIKIGLLSNHPHHNTIENILTKYDLFKYFDIVVTSANYGKRKPHPDVFKYTLKEMGLEKEANSCMMCGDEHADIVGGHQMGLKTVLFEREYKFPFEKDIPLINYIKIKKLSEILRYIA